MEENKNPRKQFTQSDGYYRELSLVHPPSVSVPDLFAL